MDAQIHVGELRSATIDHLRSWKTEGDTLLKAAKALGIEGDVIARFEATVPTTTPTRRRRTRTRSRSNGAHARVTGEQILGALQGEPMNQSRLAAMFGTTRQTIAKRLDALEREGQVTVIGTGARKMWRAQELATVGSG